MAKTNPFEPDYDLEDNPFIVEESKPDTLNKPKDKFESVRKQLDDTKKTTQEVINKVVRRDEELDRLIDRSSTLNQHSFTFKRTSQQLRRQMWCDNLQKKTCLIFGILLLISVVIIIIVEASKNKH